MDEQVVPSFGTLAVHHIYPNAHAQAHVHSHDGLPFATKTKASLFQPSSLSPSTTTVPLSQNDHTKKTSVSTSTCTPPLSQDAKKNTQSSVSSKPSPAHSTHDASEYDGKMRWQTPTRTGTWREPWQSARELGLLNYSTTQQQQQHSAHHHTEIISKVVRNALCHAIVTYVGPHLFSGTVEKWLCLLFDYLELNLDEQLLVVCLLRRYAKCGGRFVGERDWLRPQRWECVIAIACYLSVLLTEEFPGRTALDLKELLGPMFQFGVEQVAFLKAISWKICIARDEITDVLTCCWKVDEGDVDALNEMKQWFSAEARDVSDAKLWASLKKNEHDESSKKYGGEKSEEEDKNEKNDKVNHDDEDDEDNAQVPTASIHNKNNPVNNKDKKKKKKKKSAEDDVEHDKNVNSKKRSAAEAFAPPPSAAVVPPSTHHQQPHQYQQAQQVHQHHHQSAAVMAPPYVIRRIDRTAAASIIPVIPPYPHHPHAHAHPHPHVIPTYMQIPNATGTTTAIVGYYPDMDLQQQQQQQRQHVWPPAPGSTTILWPQ